MYDFTHQYIRFCKNVTGLCLINTEILKNIYFTWCHQKEKACYASLRMILIALLSRFLTGKNFCLDHVLRRTESRAWDSACLMLGSMSPGLASDSVHFKPHFSSTGTSGPDTARSSYCSTTSGPAAACSQQVEPALWAIKIFLDVIPTLTTTQHRSNKKRTGIHPSKPQKWNSSVSSPFSKSPKYPKLLLSHNPSRSHEGSR